MVATSKITDKENNKSQVTIPALRVSNPTRTTVKREKSREPDARGWYLNSRALRHVCNSRDMFLEFRPMFHEKKVMEDTDFVDVDGRGKVAFRFKSGEVVIISNVLYVPTMKINLLSVDKLYDIGYRFHYDQDKEVVIKEDGKRVGKGYNTCGLYRLSVHDDWADSFVKLD